MRGSKEGNRLSTQDNISINISVNLRKPEARRLPQPSEGSAQAATTNKIRAVAAQENKPAKQKISPQKKLNTISTNIQPSQSRKIPKSSRTFSQAPETVRLKTGETNKSRKSKLTLKKKLEPRKKSLSNDKVRRRKDSIIHKSVENFGRGRLVHSLSKTPAKSSKSKSDGKSSKKGKKRKYKVQIGQRYINTFDGEGITYRNEQQLPHEQIQHLASRYRKQSVSKLKDGKTTKRQHKKNPTLDDKIKKPQKSKIIDKSVEKLPKSAKTSITISDVPKQIRKFNPIVRLQKCIRAFLARRQIEKWKARQESDEVVIQRADSQNSLRTVELIEEQDDNQLIYMIQGLSRQSQGHPLSKQLIRIAEAAKKRQQRHRQLLKQNEQLKAIIEINKQKQSISSEENQKKKQIESFKDFQEETNRKFDRLVKTKRMEHLDIQKIEEELNEQREKIVSPNTMIRNVQSPRNIILLLREKQKLLGDKHQKEVEMLTQLFNKALVSPKTYQTKLTVLHKVIEQEKTGIERSKRQAERLSKLIKTIRNDREQIDKLDALCRQQLWQDAKNIVNQMPSKPQQFFQQQESVDRTKIDKIFNAFEADIRNDNHIQIINMDEEYRRQQTQVTEKTENSRGKPEPFKTDIYFIKDYATSLCQYILQDSYLRVSFLRSIQTPLKFDFLEYLSWYRLTDKQQIADSYNSFKDSLLYPYYKISQMEHQHRIISKQMSTLYNATNEELKMNDRNSDTTILQLQQSFLDSVLDALNQSFDLERPCSTKGVPEPWIEVSIRPHHKPNEVRDEEDNLIMCARAINRLIEWATFYCGTMTEHVTYENSSISEEQQQKIRDTRLTLMLQRSILDTQKQLMDCEAQSTEVKLQLAQLIFDRLMQQFMTDYFRLK